MLATRLAHRASFITLRLLVRLLPVPAVGRPAQGSPDVVISQIYGGGGGASGSTYPRDADYAGAERGSTALLAEALQYRPRVTEA